MREGRPEGLEGLEGLEHLEQLEGGKVRTQQVASLPRGDGRLAGEGGNGDKSGFHGVELFRNLTSMAWKNGTIRVPWRGKTANLTSMAWNFSKTTTPGAGGKEVRGE